MSAPGGAVRRSRVATGPQSSDNDPASTARRTFPSCLPPTGPLIRSFHPPETPKSSTAITPISETGK